MTRFFEADDFRTILKHKVRSSAEGRRGEHSRLARGIGIHTTTLSQILSGKKPMSPEHAVQVCDHFGFSDLESKFFLRLVQLDRAGSERLRNVLLKELTSIREESRDLKKVIPTDKKLTLEQKATFYSHWLYSAIRVLSSIPGLQTRTRLMTRLGLSARALGDRVDFLLSCGLCVAKDAKAARPPTIEPGPRYTHLEKDSPLLPRHHANWRMKAMERHPSLTDEELSYTSPMSLSKEDAVKVREKLVELIREVNRIRDPSPCEVAYCLNVDWFQF